MQYHTSSASGRTKTPSSTGVVAGHHEIYGGDERDFTDGCGAPASRG